MSTMGRHMQQRGEAHRRDSLPNLEHCCSELLLEMLGNRTAVHLGRGGGVCWLVFARPGHSQSSQVRAPQRMRPLCGSRCQAPATHRSSPQRSLLSTPSDHRYIFINACSPHPLQRGPLRTHTYVRFRAFSGTPYLSLPNRDRELLHDFRTVIRDQGLAAAEAKLQNLITTSGVPDADVFAVFLQEYARRQFAPQMHALFRAMRSSGVPLNRHGARRVSIS